MSVLARGRGMRRVRRGWFEVARPRRNDGTRTTVGGWLVGWAERADCGEREWRKGNE